VAFWATTFNIDLAFFNEYLLRRLGDPPLNAVVLADRDCLDVSLDRAAERPELLAPVNRRWLLRGVSIGNGRFHPKSYLAVTGRTATLLVGSGNLSRYGIDQGREVFATFRSGTSPGDAAIATWMQWMRQLVSRIGDTSLAERFADLESRLPSTTSLSVVVDSPLLHNLSQPLIGQFLGMVGNNAVDELRATAPFYDESADALGRLVGALRPQRVEMFMTSSTSVDGSRLRERLAASGSDIRVSAYQPDDFTHAKLIGVTQGPAGLLMSGSANLSHAALTLTAAEGNVELAVVTRSSAEAVRAAFIPPGVTAEWCDLSALDHLQHRTDSAPETATSLVRLERAVLTPSGQLHLVVASKIDPTWAITDGQVAIGLALNDGESSALTAAPIAAPLVRLINAVAQPISNWCVVDDPVALSSALTAGERTVTRSTPAELTAGDLETPLGRALLYMHQTMVMDVSELSPTSGTDAVEVGEAQADDDNIWQRLEREQLQRDPRVAGYHRLLAQTVATPVELSDRVVDLLEAMRLRTPSFPREGACGVLQALTLGPGERRGQGHQWTSSARIKVRARNVLHRWATAQTDSRLAFIDPLAPLVNLLHITIVLLGLWPYTLGAAEGPTELDANDLDELWVTWFQPLIGTGNNDGWIDRVEATSDRYRALVTAQLADNITALCWLAIRPGEHRRERTIAWQPYLRAAFDRGLINDAPDVAAYLTSAMGTSISTERVADDLLRSLDFIDDELWCARMATDLGLGQVELTAPSAAQRIALRLGVSGIDQPLLDARLPRLIVAARHYRHTDAIAVHSLEHSWRLVVDPTEPAAYRDGDSGDLSEAEGLFTDRLDALASVGGVLAEWFPDATKAA
jgi:HKD family nuclease